MNPSPRLTLWWLSYVPNACLILLQLQDPSVISGGSGHPSYELKFKQWCNSNYTHEQHLLALAASLKFKAISPFLPLLCGQFTFIYTFKYILMIKTWFTILLIQAIIGANSQVSICCISSEIVNFLNLLTHIHNNVH